MNACPFCDYQLEGLPSEHRCPECGQLVDRIWKLFGDDSKWHNLAPHWKWIIAAGTASISAFGLVASRNSLFSLHWWELIMIALLLCDGFFRVLRKPSVFAAVGLAGIVIFDRRQPQKPKAFAWEQISEAYADCRGRLTLKVHGEWIVMAWNAGVREAQRCAEYINCHLDDMRESSAGNQWRSVPSTDKSSSTSGQ